MRQLPLLSKLLSCFCLIACARDGCRNSVQLYNDAMDEFAQTFERDHLPEWSDQYLDYQSLQDKVETAVASNNDEETTQYHQNQVESELAYAHINERYMQYVAALTLRLVLLQPLLTRTLEKSSPFTESKSRLYNEICTISKAHTSLCKIACQTGTQTTLASGTLVKSTCKSCTNTGKMCQTCCRYLCQNFLLNYICQAI